MNQSVVRVHVHEHAGTIILNRPQQRNALSRELLDEIKQALDDLHQEKRVRAVILTGAGTSFCAGMDLKEMLQTQRGAGAQLQWPEDVRQLQELYEQMLLFPKPLIAAVNGPALAGGAGLVLACDIVLAAHGATFGLPEPLRGLTAGIVAPLLAFRISGGYAAYLLTTARAIDAAEAQRLGLFHELVADEQLWPRATQLAAECARCAPQSIQATKRMLNENIGEHLTTLLSAGAAISAAARTTEAAAEGLAAFAEKRAPVWP